MMFGVPGFGTGTPGFAEADADLYLGSVVALRSWGLNTDGVLIGLFGGSWNAGENLATCRRPKMSWIPSGAPHDVPGNRCGCGFWAYWWDRVNLPVSQSYNAGVAKITGAVQVYGNTLWGSKGLRASKARILAVAPTEEIGDRPKVLDMLREFDSNMAVYHDVNEMAAHVTFTPAPAEDELVPVQEETTEKES